MGPGEGEIFMLAVSQARRARVLLLSMALVSTAPMFATPVLAQSMADTPTNEIVVTADRRDSFGADFVQAGTFRDARLVDTPLTVAIMTRSLLDAQQARSINDAVRNTAGVSQAQINTSIYSNLAVRGITLNNFTNVRWNGVLPVVNLIEQPIESLDRAQWEALCDGCGKCCIHKLEDEETGELVPTNVACRLLDRRSGQCSNYRHRRAYVSECVRLTMGNVRSIDWLPTTCAYRLRAANEPLPDWHYLVCGDREAVHRAGQSVRGWTISEDDAGDFENHIVDREL